MTTSLIPSLRKRGTPTTLLTVAALASLLGIGNMTAAADGGRSELPVILGAGAGWGLLWTVVAAAVAPRLRRSAATRRAWYDVPVLLALTAMTMQAGAGLVQHLMFGSAEPYLALQQSEAAEGSLIFFLVLNPLTEWVFMPLALYLNWRSAGRRRFLLAAAAAYYAERAVTYLYFAPTVVGWKDEPVTTRLLDEVSFWLAADWLRLAVIAGIITALALAVVRRRPGRAGATATA
ncbi:hypothetical protein [Actinomadura sediminis]|uniref:Pr6Pr family membrane protein n=1 Tax=Actinomadura sediminis TaxID=1038904 RepID=A0ABW3ELS6_9ACTN